MNLAVCVPLSWDYTPTPFLISFSKLLAPSELEKLRLIGVERHFQLFNRAFPLDHNRNGLVKKALELGADLVLFLDADMTFPKGLAAALAEDCLRTGAGVVSGCYFKKAPPHPCVSALFLTPDDPQLMTPIDPLAEPEAGADGADGGGEEGTGGRLVSCDVVGMGAALVRREVFESIDYPWFEYEVHEKTGEMTVTEDVPFCRKAKEKGFEILTDTSLVCGHVAQVEIDDRHWRRAREALTPESAEPAASPADSLPDAGEHGVLESV